MPDINGNVVEPQDISADVSTDNGNMNGTVEAEQGEITGTITSNDATVNGSIASNVLAVSGAVNSDENTISPTLTVRPGLDGKDGKDGFSPIIDVYKDTPAEYILKVTDARGSYLTPNLYPDIDEWLKIKDKVDENLAKYELVNPLVLTQGQRENSYLYLRRDDISANQKISLDQVALNAEVDEKIRLKLQSVSERPEDWRVGDFIFLESSSGGE